MNFGLFSGPYSDWYEDSGIRFIESENVELKENTFTGFNPEGLVVFDTVSKLEVDGNTFEVATDGLLYDIDADEVGWTSYFMAVDFKECYSVTMTSNSFTSNDLSDLTMPWVYFKDCTGTSCISANSLCFVPFQSLRRHAGHGLTWWLLCVF